MQNGGHPSVDSSKKRESLRREGTRNGPIHDASETFFFVARVRRFRANWARPAANWVTRVISRAFAWFLHERWRANGRTIAPSINEWVHQDSSVRALNAVTQIKKWQLFFFFVCLICRYRLGSGAKQWWRGIS